MNDFISLQSHAVLKCSTAFIVSHMKLLVHLEELLSDKRLFPQLNKPLLALCVIPVLHSNQHMGCSYCMHNIAYKRQISLGMEVRKGSTGRGRPFLHFSEMTLPCLQFYNVEVKVIPPDGKGAPKIRSVLRRYTHFTRLFEKVALTPKQHSSAYSAMSTNIFFMSRDKRFASNCLPVYCAPPYPP